MPIFDPTEYVSDSTSTKLLSETTAVFIAESMERNPGQRADYFNIAFRVITGPHSGEYFYDNFSLSDKALWRLGKLAMAMGQDGSLDLEDDDDVGDYFLDREFAGTTEVQEDPQYGDKAKLNIKTLRVLSEDEKKEVKTVYKDKGTAHDEGWRGTPRAAKVDKDDVPF